MITFIAICCFLLVCYFMWRLLVLLAFWALCLSVLGALALGALMLWGALASATTADESTPRAAQVVTVSTRVPTALAHCRNGMGWTAEGGDYCL